MAIKTKISKEDIQKRIKAAEIPDDSRINLDEFQAAKLINCSVHKLRRDRWSGGGIPFVKVSDHGTVRYQRTDIDAYLRSRLRTSTSDPGVMDHAHKG